MVVLTFTQALKEEVGGGGQLNFAQILSRGSSFLRSVYQE